jgi:hypothetical protein
VRSCWAFAPLPPLSAVGGCAVLADGSPFGPVGTGDMMASAKLFCRIFASGALFLYLREAALRVAWLSSSTHFDGADLPFRVLNAPA